MSKLWPVVKFPLVKLNDDGEGSDELEHRSVKITWRISRQLSDLIFPILKATAGKGEQEVGMALLEPELIEKIAVVLFDFEPHEITQRMAPGLKAEYLEVLNEVVTLLLPAEVEDKSPEAKKKEPAALAAV